jgi:hypothetical protein
VYICTRITVIVKHFIGAISSAGSEHPDSIGRVRVAKTKHIGAISSAGSEHPDSIGRVRVAKTKHIGAISSAGSEHLVYTEGVGGSNPSSPT